MKNLVIQGYINWLQKFRLANKTHSTSVQISTRLIADLKNTESIDTLNDLIKTELTRPTSTDDSIHQYMPPMFYKQLSDWQNTLAKINGDCDTSLIILQDVPRTPENTPFIDLLKDILNDKRARMHHRITSILSVLRNEHFPDLLLYITKLAEKPYPTNPKEGDFAAIQPVNEYHRTCLHMLNNLAQSPNSHPDWSAGNGLLQAALLVYLDMHSEEINLDDSDDFTPPKNDNSTCYLM